MTVDEQNLPDNGPEAQAEMPIDRLDLLKETLLGRLAHLVELAQGESGGNHDPAIRRLINHSIYSTYCDCVDFGLRQEARELLESISWGTAAH